MIRLKDINIPEPKAGLTIYFNEHKTDYSTVQEYINRGYIDEDDWASEEEKQLAIENNTLWGITWYPDTPVGCYCVYASTIDAVSKRAEEISLLS